MVEIFFLAGILLISFLILYLLYKETALIAFVILTLLVIPASISTTLRTVIQITDFIIVFYMFFREYGLELNRYPRIPGYVIIFLIILYLSLFLSIIFSDYPAAGLIFVARTSIFFILIYLFSGIIRTQKLVRVVILSIFLSGFILVSSLIIDFIMMGRDLTYLFQPMRELNYGIYSNYNVTGSYGIIVFPIIISALYNDRLKKFKPLIWSAIIILLVGILLLASRAALTGIVLGAAIILYFNNRKAFKKLAFTVIVILFIYFLMNPFGPSLDYALRLKNGLSGHDHFWKLALNIFNDNPVVGIGPGAYPIVEFNYFPVMLNSFTGEMMIEIHNLTASASSNNSHSFYLTMMSDMGVFGMITLISLFFVFFKTVRIVYVKFKEINREVFLINILSLSVGICLAFRGFVESSGIFYYGTIAADLPFWLLFIIQILYANGSIPTVEKEVNINYTNSGGNF